MVCVVGNVAGNAVTCVPPTGAVYQPLKTYPCFKGIRDGQVFPAVDVPATPSILAGVPLPPFALNMIDTVAGSGLGTGSGSGTGVGLGVGSSGSGSGILFHCA